MKLNTKIYPHADPKKWLVFTKDGQEQICLEFALRLAAFFEYKNKKGIVYSGYRDLAYQQKLYAENCKEHPPKGNGLVASPKVSWHPSHCAIDLSDEGFWKKYMLNGDMKKTAQKQELAKFGLCIPLNNVDTTSVLEWWHIQPIETLGYHGDRTKWLDKDDMFYSKSYIFKEDNDMFKDDVLIAKWAKPSVDKLEQLKIITGDVNGNFNPKATVTREEMAALLDRVLKLFGK